MKTKITIILLSISILGYAQKYKELGNDPKGDNIGSAGVDIKSVSMAIDQTADSIWILVDAHDSIAGDWGLALIFDTNQVNTDGKSWGLVNKANNNDLKYDLKLDLLNNKYFPPTHAVLYDTSGKKTNQNIVLLRPDSFSVVIRIRLSDLDQDAKFDVVAGSGSFDGYLYDNLPNAGKLTYDANSTTGIAHQIDKALIVYPNPCKDAIYFNNGSNLTRIQLINLNGTTLLDTEFDTEDPVLNVSYLPSGIYVLQSTDIKNQITKQLIYKH
ncbi:MAG: hypothetical protein CL840_07510 [Crocinitomicaceae bacterium]|nr:hypothetical protein [Crocinitomicaceae bacterium]|tara:strand:- start:7930 stop:8739 length:810 start_codon:yes stop_codon:yes gene_type:complete